MKDIKLDSILLFTLVTPFIMMYRLSPGNTQYWLFGLIFLGLLTYVVLDMFAIREKVYVLLKQVVLWLIIILVIGTSFTAAIMVRHKNHPIYMIHDIILQQEAAIRFLLDGKNPYAVDYKGTFLEEWHYSDTEENPALYHFVMEPAYLLSAIPVYYIANRSVGYFDGRMPLIGLFVTLLVLASMLIKDHDKKRLFIILLAFHPSMLPYTLEGRSDMYMYPFLFAAFFLLYKQRYFSAGIPAGIAFAIKQSAWPVIPFYTAYVYFKTKSISKAAGSLVAVGIPFLLFVMPFLTWDSKAFYDSTIGFLMGTTKHSYPIAGYGLGSMLLEFGVIKDKFAYYPFSLWQAAVCIPVLIGLVIALKKEVSVRRMILAYGIFLFVYWYLSRYFHNSHVGYVSYILLTAYFWPEERKPIEKPAALQKKKQDKPAKRVFKQR